jgi:hypothetical protein
MVAVFGARSQGWHGVMSGRRASVLRSIGTRSPGRQNGFPPCSTSRSKASSSGLGASISCPHLVVVNWPVARNIRGWAASSMR